MAVALARTAHIRIGAPVVNCNGYRTRELRERGTERVLSIEVSCTKCDPEGISCRIKHDYRGLLLGEKIDCDGEHNYGGVLIAIIAPEEKMSRSFIDVSSVIEDHERTHHEF